MIWSRRERCQTGPLSFFNPIWYPLVLPNGVTTTVMSFFCRVSRKQLFLGQPGHHRWLAVTQRGPLSGVQAGTDDARLRKKLSIYNKIMHETPKYKTYQPQAGTMPIVPFLHSSKREAVYCSQEKGGWIDHGHDKITASWGRLRWLRCRSRVGLCRWHARPTNLWIHMPLLAFIGHIIYPESILTNTHTNPFFSVKKEAGYIVLWPTSKVPITRRIRTQTKDTLILTDKIIEKYNKNKKHSTIYLLVDFKHG